jgi:hypothetical protein
MIIAQMDLRAVIERKVTGEKRMWTVGSLLQSDFPNQLKKVRKLLFPEAEKEIGAH